MAEGIADLFVVLTAQTTPLIEGFVKAGEAGERMAEQIKAATTAVTESIAGLGAKFDGMAAGLGASAEKAAASLRVISESAQQVAGLVDASYVQMEAGARQWAAVTAESAAQVKAAQESAVAGTKAVAAEQAAANKTVADGAKTAGAESAAAAEASAAGAVAASGKTKAANKEAASSFGQLKEGAQAAESGMSTIFNKGLGAISAFGTQSGIVFAGLAGAVAVHSVKMAGDFQASTARLVATGGELQQNLAKDREDILKTSSDIGYSATQMSQALYQATSVGYRGADGIKVLTAAAQGAKSENADLTNTMKVLTDILVDYHLGADQAGNVTSKMVAAAQSGKMSFNDLASSLASVLPQASAAHISMEDIMGDLATMTSHGMSAQRATRNLNNALQAMQVMNGPQVAELGMLGLSKQIIQTTLQTKGLSGAMEQIQQAIEQHMGPAGKVIIDLKQSINSLPPAVQGLANEVLSGSISFKDYNKQISELPPEVQAAAKSWESAATSNYKFGNTQVSATQAIQTNAEALRLATGNMTAAGVATQITGENSGRTANAINNIKNATTDAAGNVKGWAEVQDNFNTKMDQAKASLGALAIQIGNVVLPWLTKLAAGVADVAKWMAQHKAVVIGLSIALGTVLALAFAALALKVASFLKNTAQGLAGWVGKFRKAGTDAGAGLSEGITEGSAGAEAAAVSMSQKVLNALKRIFRISSPSAVTMEMGENVDQGLAEGIEAGTVQIITAIDGMYNRAIEEARVKSAELKEAMAVGGVGGTVAKGGGAAAEEAEVAAAGAGKGGFKVGPLGMLIGGQLLGAGLKAVGDDSQKTYSGHGVGDFLKSGANTAGDVLSLDPGAVIGDITKSAKALPGDLKNIGNSPAAKMIDSVKKDLDNIGNSPGAKLWHAIFGGGDSSGNDKAAAGMKKVADAGKEAMKAMDPGLLEKFTNGLKGIGDKIAQPFKDGWDKVKQFFAQSPQQIGKELADALAGTIKTAVKWGTDFVKGLGDGFQQIGAFFASLPGKIGQFFSNAGTWLVTEGTKIWQGFITGLNNAWTTVSTWFTQLPDKIHNFFSQAPSWLLQHGKDVITGFWNGLKNVWNSVTGWIGGVITGFIDEFKKDFGIASPSTIFDSIGQDLINGFWNGLKKVWTQVTSWLSNAASNLVASAKKVLGIASPSTVFHEMGMFLGQGFLDGSEEGFEPVHDRMRNHGRRAMEGFQKGMSEGGAGGGADSKSNFNAGFQSTSASTDSRAMMKTYFGVGGSSYYDQMAEPAERAARWRQFMEQERQKAQQQMQQKSSSGSSGSSSGSSGGMDSGSGGSGGSGGGSSMEQMGEKAGKDLTSGMDKGMKQTSQQVLADAKKLATDAMNAIKLAAGIDPSTKQGQETIKGLQAGLQKDVQKLQADSKKTGDDVTTSMADGLGVSKTSGGAGTQSSSGKGMGAVGENCITSMGAGMKKQQPKVQSDSTTWAGSSGPLLQSYTKPLGMASTSDGGANTEFGKMGQAQMTGLDAGQKQQQPTVEQNAKTFAASPGGPFVQAFLGQWGMTSPTDASANTIWYKMGQAMMQGLANGIQAGQQTAVQAATTAATAVKNAMQTTTGVQSPSWITHRMGRFMMEGLGNGIREFAHVAREAAKFASQSVIDGFGDLSNGRGIAGILGNQGAANSDAQSQARQLFGGMGGLIPPQVMSSALRYSIRSQELNDYNAMVQAAQQAQQAQQNSSQNSNGSGFDMGGSGGGDDGGGGGDFGGGGGGGGGGGQMDFPQLGLSDMWAPQGWGDQSGWYGFGGLPGVTSGPGSGLAPGDFWGSRRLDRYEFGYGGYGGFGGGGYGGYGYGGYGGFGEGGGGDIHIHVNVAGNLWQTSDLVSTLKNELLRTNIRNSQNGTIYNQSFSRLS